MSTRAELGRQLVGATVRQSRRDLRWVLRNRLDGDPVRWAARTAVLAAGAALVFAALLHLALLAVDVHVPYWQLWTVLTALLVSLWVGGTIGSEPLPEPPEPDPPPVERSARAFPQVDYWAMRLAERPDDPARYARLVRDRIAGVVAARLRLRHGVRMSAEPDRARAILDPRLYRFLTEAEPAPPDPPTLSRLITLIEEI